jgi:hypothetical protein
MLRKYLLAGMAVALVAGPVLSISTAARANDRPDGSEFGISRYYIVKDENGKCRVRNSWRLNSLGQYKSMARAQRALQLKQSIGVC